MQDFLKQAQHMSTDDLIVLSDAISDEVERRLSRARTMPDSARRRANRRRDSYCRSAGSAAPPIAAIGFMDSYDPRVA